MYRRIDIHRRVQSCESPSWVTVRDSRWTEEDGNYLNARVLEVKEFQTCNDTSTGLVTSLKWSRSYTLNSTRTAPCSLSECVFFPVSIRLVLLRSRVSAFHGLNITQFSRLSWGVGMSWNIGEKSWTSTAIRNLSACMSITKRKRENEEKCDEDDGDDCADFDGHGRGVSVTAGGKKRVLTRFRHDRTTSVPRSLPD